MKFKSSSLDILRILPQDTVDKILSVLPIRDALRTSILSRKWRHCWTSIPMLSFDDKFFEGSKEMTKHKFVNAIFQVLMLHKGQLMTFNLWIKLEMDDDQINQIVVYLSRIDTLKNLTLLNFMGNRYKLPSSFFSFQGLEHLEISKCNFDPPSTFNGFSKLTWLTFHNVMITTKTLKRFLTSCPLLKCFFLLGRQLYFTTEKACTFIELFECLPSIEEVAISRYHMKYMAEGGTPLKLPTSLVHLRKLMLGVCFMEQDALSATLCLINSSPNLKHILLRLQPIRTSVNGLDLRGYSNLKLNHLDILEMVNFSNLAIEMKFLKLIMAKSDVLNKARIEIGEDVSIFEELRMLRDYIRMPFPFASASARLNFERPTRFIGKDTNLIGLLQ